MDGPITMREWMQLLLVGFTGAWLFLATLIAFIFASNVAKNAMRNIGLRKRKKINLYSENGYHNAKENPTDGTRKRGND